MIAVKEFLVRWWKLLAGAIGVALALAAVRRAEGQVERARERHLGTLDEEISNGWDDIGAQSEEVREALIRADRVKENAKKRLDGVAEVSNADVISEWNADRLRKRP